MNEQSINHQSITPLPPDNPQRASKVVNSDSDPNLPHIGLVGDTYTVLLSGNDTNGRYCLIDMYVRPDGDRRRTAMISRKAF
jgi:hypothetical protein